jgi:hypothetical protein
MNRPMKSTPARGFAAAMVFPFLMALAAGLSGCIENPGADRRLNNEEHFYAPIASARFSGAEVFQFQAKEGKDGVVLRLICTAREVVDSATFFLQFTAPQYFGDSDLYSATPAFELIGRLKHVTPGDTVDWGLLTHQTGLHLMGDSVRASLLQFADGSPRSIAIGGLYEGSYSLLDSARYRYSGTLRGMVDGEGRYQFRLDLDRVRGVRGGFRGEIDVGGRAAGNLRFELNGSADPQPIAPAPFAVESTTFYGLANLKGSFLPAGPGQWLDSLGYDLHGVFMTPD